MSGGPALSVRFAQLERRGVLLGLSGGQVAALGVALVVAVTAEYTAGALGVVLSAPLWGVAAVLAVPVAGRPVLGWAPLVGGWSLRRASGSASRRTPVAAAGQASLVVPGLSARLVLAELPSLDAAVLVDRRAGTVTAVLPVEGAGLALAEPGAQEQRVNGWGRLLASWCAQPDVLRAQVLARTVPGGTAPVRRWWAEHAVAGCGWPAQVVAGLLADADTLATRAETLLAVTLRTPGGGRDGLDGDRLEQVGRRLEVIADTVGAAELRQDGWLTADGLAAALRTCFDPYSPGGRDQVAGTPPVAGMALDERWDRLRTDTAWHAVFWLREWPRTEVHPAFLQPLLLGGAHRAFSLTVEPLPTGRALRDIRRAKVEQAADAAQRVRIGRVEDAAHRAEAADVARREAELVAGHGDLAFTGLLTVSAPSEAELDAACAATEAAAAQAMCELRRLVGQQAAAFTAGALPLARSTA